MSHFIFFVVFLLIYAANLLSFRFQFQPSDIILANVIISHSYPLGVPVSGIES